MPELNPSAQSRGGCARCLVSLLLQLSHIPRERIAGYIALRSGREAAHWKKKKKKKKRGKKKKKEKRKKTPPRRNDSRYWRDGEANKVSAISKGK